MSSLPSPPMLRCNPAEAVAGAMVAPIAAWNKAKTAAGLAAIL